MKQQDDAIDLALQLAYEYPDGDVSAICCDALDTYVGEDEPAPCDYDDLTRLVMIAKKWKDDGKSFDEARVEMINGVECSS